MRVKPYIKMSTGDEELIMDKSLVGLTNVDNIRQYSASNPPPYPVTSVNGKTGAIELSDLSGTRITNDSGITVPTMSYSTLRTEAKKEFYPVGSLYLTVSTTSPASIFGGTWEKLTQDAYLKIVASGAGGTGGRGDHKIQVTNIPSHAHSLGGVLSSAYHTTANTSGSSAWGAYGLSNETGTTGGGQAYYPYYYGIYVWKRTK